jgi:phosphoribosylglycinamide formyltransferase 1
VSSRVVVLISGTGSNMMQLARAGAAGELRGTVVGVVADRPCRGLELAAREGIPTALVAPGDHPSRHEWNEALRDVVCVHRPDLVVSAGFMRILGPAFVDCFYGRLINLHPSLLPAFPGAHAVRDALAAGVKWSGTTVHLVDHEVDHGRILMQEPVPVHDDDSEESLHARIKSVEHRLLIRACNSLVDVRTETLEAPAWR